MIRKLRAGACGVLVAATAAIGGESILPRAGHAQHVNARPSGEAGAWRYIGGDAGHTRSTPLDQINPSNFGDLEIDWTWSSASFGAAPPRSTPVYADGKLFTVAGPRRHVVALDAETGEVVWAFREPSTFRWEYSMRAAWGKGGSAMVRPFPVSSGAPPATAATPNSREMAAAQNSDGGSQDNAHTPR